MCASRPDRRVWVGINQGRLFVLSFSAKRGLATRHVGNTATDCSDGWALQGLCRNGFCLDEMGVGIGGYGDDHTIVYVVAGVVVVGI